MKTGDLVRLKGTDLGAVGVVVDIIQKKVWRTQIRGNLVDWGMVNPEPHAVVLFHHNNGTCEIPFIELYLAAES